jgi:CubicO group peptidase (beta-lactamase class C family)
MTVCPRTVTGRGRSLLAAALVGSLALAACAGDDGADSAADIAVSATAPEAPAAGTVPTTTEPVTTEPATTEPAADPSTTNVDPSAFDFSAVGPIVDAALVEHGLEGAALVVVERDAGIVHEQYWGEFGPERVSLIASSSKMVVAGVLLRLSDMGLIDLDAPVADVVDWGSANPSITPAQLVSNSSGLVGLGPNPAYPPYLCQFLPGGTLQECAASIFTSPEDDADVIAPDTEFRYGGAQWQVAGAVAEAVSGQTWAELIAQTYVEPCGVASLGFNNHWTQFPLRFEYPTAFTGDPSTLAATLNPNIEGGAYVTPPDYARLLLMLLRDGRCGDTPVLSPESVARMLTDRTAEAYDDASTQPGYAMGWYVDRISGRRTDPGAYGSVPWLDVAGGHGAFLVIEATTQIGGEIAGDLFGPVADAIAAGR